MKIAIAGSTGVLGRTLIPILLQQGYEVRTLARSAEKAITYSENSANIQPLYDWMASPPLPSSNNAF